MRIMREPERAWKKGRTCRSVPAFPSWQLGARVRSHMLGIVTESVCNPSGMCTGEVGGGTTFHEKEGNESKRSGAEGGGGRGLGEEETQES